MAKLSLIGDFFKTNITSGLPNRDEEEKELVEIGNKIVMNEKSKEPQKHDKIVHGPYTVLSPKKLATIGKFAAEHGNSKAMRQFEIPESTARYLKKLYLKTLKRDGSVNELQHGNRGRPLNLCLEAKRNWRNFK